MSDSIRTALNQAAEIFGHAPLTAEASQLFYRAAGTADEQGFIRRLFDLVKTADRFPLPRDFAQPWDGAA